MLFGRNEQRILRYILIPAALILVGLAVYFIIGVPVVNILSADVEYAVVQGKPGELSNTDIEDSFSDLSDGTIETGEWIVPVAGGQYGEINCETIGLKVPLYYGDTDDILLKGAGQSLLSECPGLGGTTIVGGHDTTFFAPLEKLTEGKEIVISTTYGTYTYSVDTIDIIEGADFSLADYEKINDKAEKLILYTCYPFGDILSERSQRIIYTCSMNSGPVIGGASDE